jgi:LmbE family N-acetylglucosaminyl deacetylase
MKKILGIFCHPDDEVLAGWPIFQSDEYEKHLIILCDDALRNRPLRKRALLDVCQQENIGLIGCLSLDNNFYALPTRRADSLLTHAIIDINKVIEIGIDFIKPDYIFTHNPVGEYGHGSHRLCFELVSQHPKVERLIFTDMCQESNHRSSAQIPFSVREAYYVEKFDEAIKILDVNFYNRTKAIYDKHNAWTWSKPPIKTAILFYLRNYHD